MRLALNKWIAKPTEAAKRLQVSIRTARGLFNLESRLVREQQTARTRRYVSSSLIQGFVGEYISVVDFAAQSGRLPGIEAI